MTVHVETDGELTVIRPEVAYLDASTARGLRREVVGRVPRGARAILDLSDVVFVDSTGCGAILACLKHVHAEPNGPGELKVCTSAPAVRALFEMVRLQKIIEVHNTRDEAVRSYRVA